MAKNNLKYQRDRIIKIDIAIIELLSRRFKFVKQIGLIKSRVQKKIVDKNREKELMLIYKKQALTNNLPAELVKKIFKMIIKYSKDLQKHERSK